MVLFKDIINYNCFAMNENAEVFPIIPGQETAHTDEGFLMEGRAFLEQMAPVLSTIAESSSLSFEPSATGSSFNHREGVINLAYDPKKGVATNLFVGTHEIGHFRDLVNTPDDYLEMIEHIQRESNTMADQIEKSRTDEVLSETQKEGLRKAIHDELFLLYNVAEDIAVNRRVAEKVPQFRRDGSQREVVNELYSKHSFPERNLSQDPSHRQLAYALLLGHMTAEQYQYSADVVSTLNRSVDSLGTSLFEDISSLTNPGTHAGRNMGERLKRVRQTIEPIYKQLLWQELDKAINEKNSQGDQSDEGGGQGNQSDGGGGQGNQSDEGDREDLVHDWGAIKGGLDNHISEEDVKNAKEYERIENQESKERLKTPEERARDAQRKADEHICTQYGVKRELAKSYRAIEERIRPYIESVADVFEEFMKSVEQRIQTFYIEYSKSGKLNVDSYIKKFADFSSLPSGEHLIPWESMSIYDQRDFISRIALYPTEVNFRLVLDTSGSMSGERMDRLGEMLVLFLESLSTFESRMNIRFRLREPFQVNTEIRKFDSASKVIKPFQDRTDYRREQAARFASVGELVSGGSTKDLTPMEEINNSIGKRDEDLYKAGKKSEIVILITDGGSSTEEETRAKVAELQGRGVQVKGLQIGDPSDREKRTFENIFGEDGKQIGNLDDLAPSLIDLFREFIERIGSKVEFYEQDEEY